MPLYFGPMSEDEDGPDEPGPQSAGWVYDKDYGWYNKDPSYTGLKNIRDFHKGKNQVAKSWHILKRFQSASDWALCKPFFFSQLYQNLTLKAYDRIVSEDLWGLYMDTTDARFALCCRPSSYNAIMACVPFL